MMKIQMDSSAILAVLESQGEEAKIELQKRIVQQFAARHLKAVVNTEVLQQAHQEVVKAAGFIVSELVGEITKSGGRTTVNLKPEVEKEIRIQSQRTVSGEVNRLITEAMQRKLNELNITQIVEQKIHAKILREIDSQVDERWNNLMKRFAQEVEED